MTEEDQRKANAERNRVLAAQRASNIANPSATGNVVFNPSATGNVFDSSATGNVIDNSHTRDPGSNKVDDRSLDFAHLNDPNWDTRDKLDIPGGLEWRASAVETNKETTEPSEQVGTQLKK